MENVTWELRLTCERTTKEKNTGNKRTRLRGRVCECVFPGDKNSAGYGENTGGRTFLIIFH